MRIRTFAVGVAIVATFIVIGHRGRSVALVQPTAPLAKDLRTGSVVQLARGNATLERRMTSVTRDEGREIESAFENTEQLIQKLRAIESFVDNIRRSEEWRRSGLETTANVAHAFQNLNREYSLPVAKKDARLKVASLHFLALSDSLEWPQCESSLKTLARQYERSQLQPVLWDILSLAKICARLDWRQAKSFQESLKNGTVKSQMALGLAAVSETQRL